MCQLAARHPDKPEAASDLSETASDLDHVSAPEARLESVKKVLTGYARATHGNSDRLYKTGGMSRIPRPIRTLIADDRPPKPESFPVMPRRVQSLVAMGKMRLMIPNLERIPGDGDAQARELVHELPQRVNASVAERLDDGAKLALGRYGCRAATLALQEGSINRLREALFATALGSADSRMRDPRDVMIDVALHFDFARRLGVSPSIIFDEIADRLAEYPIADLLRDFGMRTDVDLEAFGWRLIDGDAGPDVVPT